MSVTEITDFSGGLDVVTTVADYGDQALILQCDSTSEVLAWTEALRGARLPGVVDVVPASVTVLVKLAGPRFQGVTRQRIRRLRVARGEMGADAGDPADDIVIDVVYDGPDLAHVSRHTGLSPAQVIDAHTGTRWRVGFGGFAPGFAYLIGGDERLRVPRRAEPRTSVPAGAVGLAGEFSAVYPRQSPGGWQIIGHTDAVLWDIDRRDPALLTQGRWVRFRAG
ncbi:allophanate hydrolase subunit 1 [Mycobacterium sp. TY814]|uniref:5-oxoprolinase subunit B family protein n=1 Tax=Mycobacterium sp. TY814 TaxID=3050580 RepID=UPI002741BB83|nr:allophanate hydrolase subunit 1 [Mycobacterium sp. TY814]MDP7722831.1 allophanate hydrolase subunit 1 [Mycobacterium sp. TY814]